MAWACALFSSLVGHWEKRNRDAIVELDPDRLDVDALLAYFTEYGDDDGARAASTSSGSTSPARAPRPAQVDEFAAVGIDRAEDLRARFEPQLLLRLRGRRPAGGVGVPRRRQPAGRPAAADARLRHLALGRAAT